MIELKRVVRALLPGPLRSRIRLAVSEAPHRLRDFLPDLAEGVRRPKSSVPLPPARLRRRVAGTSSRSAFLSVGNSCARDFVAAFEKVRRTDSSYRLWLDFGCGSCRVTRHLIPMLPDCELWGADVDHEAIGWASAHLPGVFLPLPSMPPTTLPESSFDVVLASSVFTHLDEKSQRDWLEELRRILRPGGLLLASTHGPALCFSRPDLTSGQLALLEQTGFLFAEGSGPFNEDSAFHSGTYLRRSWGQWLDLELFLEQGLGGYQDLSVWRKPSRP